MVGIDNLVEQIGIDNDLDIVAMQELSDKLVESITSTIKAFLAANKVNESELMLSKSNEDLVSVLMTKEGLTFRVVNESAYSSIDMNKMLSFYKTKELDNLVEYVKSEGIEVR